jgi:hypothetical protein
MAATLSDSQIRDRLGPEVSIEYTRDSPLFRQQLYAFEESFSGVCSYAQKYEFFF